jgi:hypothetical protein
MLLPVALLLKSVGDGTLGPRVLGSRPDEKAALYLREHFVPGTHIGAWAPGTVWMANMQHVTMHRDLRYMKSAQDVRDWMAREKVEAIYMDDHLQKFEFSVWDTIEKQLGHGLELGFDGGEGVQVLIRTPTSDAVDVRETLL